MSPCAAERVAAKRGREPRRLQPAALDHWLRRPPSSTGAPVNRPPVRVDVLETSATVPSSRSPPAPRSGCVYCLLREDVFLGGKQQTEPLCRRAVTHAVRPSPPAGLSKCSTNVACDAGYALLHTDDRVERRPLGRQLLNPAAVVIARGSALLRNLDHVRSANDPRRSRIHGHVLDLVVDLVHPLGLWQLFGPGCIFYGCW